MVKVVPSADRSPLTGVSCKRTEEQSPVLKLAIELKTPANGAIEQMGYSSYPHPYLRNGQTPLDNF
ncbi:hypothetical protein NDI47_11630 [Microcoleus vaginatus GB1-A2]|uniref:hypothetical protein n=1 Tax=Microcoleus vaginatus TaxID=119532 RepID=UPI001681D164|nr:hypothetical protein [Microcoleus sp. FACHB-61]